MFSNETIRKLREIHMGVMAEQLSAQLEDPQFRNVPFEDRLAMHIPELRVSLCWWMPNGVRGKATGSLA